MWDKSKGNNGKGKQGNDVEVAPPWQQPAKPAKAGVAGQQDGGGITGAKFSPPADEMEVGRCRSGRRFGQNQSEAGHCQASPGKG
jgi:hypothetical protein